MAVNPTGDCDTPADGSGAGTHGADRCTWLRHCQARSASNWRAFAAQPGSEMWFLFPCPDGSTCLPKAKRALPEINAEIRGIAGSAWMASGYWRVVGRSGVWEERRWNRSLTRHVCWWRVPTSTTAQRLTASS